MISTLPPEAARRRRFRPALAPTLAALAGIVILLGLGTWQLERLAWKERLIAARAEGLAADPVALPGSAADWTAFDFRPVEVTGVFRHDLEQIFGARTFEGRFGHHVLTPLLRSDGTAVLVDRGWVPADRRAPETRAGGQVTGQLTLTGIARFRADDEPGWFTPANEPEARLWYWYDLDAMQEALGLELLPVVVEADAAPVPGGLPVGGRTRIDLPNNHLQYAVTWYGLALALLGVWVAFSLRSRAPDA